MPEREEFRLSRRSLLRHGLALVGATLLSACAPAPTPQVGTPPATQAATAAPTAAASPKAGEYPRNQTLILYMHARNPDPQQMNMFVPNNAYAWHNSIGCSNQLWFVNTDAGRTEWWLATGYEYDEGYKGMTITLRKEAKWSDGQPFTADDVVFTLETLTKNPTMAYAQPIIDWVTEIKKVDDYTVHLTFRDANPRFYLNLASTWGMSMLPKHIWEGQDPLKFTNWPPVHTGPYKIIKADIEEQVFERIDDWWGNDIFGQPAPKYVIWRYLAPETRIIEMSEHRLDAAYLAGPTDYLTIKEKNPYAIAWFDGPPYQWIDPCPRYMMLNQRKWPWNDPKVRRAMSYAIDRQKVINVAYEGYGMVNELMVPLYAWHQAFYDACADIVQKYEPTKYDPQAAEKLMQEAGFTKGSDGIWTKDGKRVTVTVITGSWVPELLRYGQVAVDAWNAIGIEATAKPQEGAGFNDPWALKTFEAITGWMCQSWYDPYFMFEKYHSKYAVPEGDRTGSNDAGYANPELDKIVDQLAVLPYDMSDPKIKQLYHDAMEILIRDTVFIPMSQSMFTLAEDTYYWEGWATSKNPYAVPGTWVPTFTFNVLRIKPTGRE
jgi:peptide/nickel transport system substrate-binding protein